MFWIIVSLILGVGVVFYAIPKRRISWDVCYPLLVGAAVMIGSIVFSMIFSQTSVAPSPPPPPAVVSEISLATYEPGFFNTSYTLKNDSKAVLLDVNIDLHLQREDGEMIPLKRFWSRWDVDEVKTFPVPNGAYEQMSVHGTANRWGKDVTINASWLINRKKP